jgi:CheY-like chemotaxis protein
VLILYADDEQSARTWVSRALQTRGYTVFSLNTGNFDQLQADAARLFTLLGSGVAPGAFVLDGHNLLSTRQGEFLADIQPEFLINWLARHGLHGDYPVILYSNDPELVARARNDPHFAAAICKVGDGGGLTALLDAIEQVTTIKDER